MSANGSWYVGSLETVAREVAATLRTLGATRFDLEHGLAGHPGAEVLRDIVPYGTEVAPLVRALPA